MINSEPLLGKKKKQKLYSEESLSSAESGVESSASDASSTIDRDLDILQNQEIYISEFFDNLNPDNEFNQAFIISAYEDFMLVDPKVTDMEPQNYESAILDYKLAKEEFQSFLYGDLEIKDLKILHEYLAEKFIEDKEIISK